MRYTLQLMVDPTCGRKHKPPYYTTQEDRLTDQRLNQTQACWLTFLSEIAAQDSRETLPARNIDVSTNITSHEMGLSRPTPLMSATLNRARTRTTLDIPRRQVHITSIPDHQHTCKVQESTPASQHGPSHTVQTIVKRRTQHGHSPYHGPFSTVE